MDISRAIKTIRYNKLLLVSALSFIITGIMSQGFMHPDEHFQILELFNMKIGSPYQDSAILNWDYHLKMRSWFQPFVYYLILFPIKNINPFTISMIIRVLNGLLGFWAIYNFLKLLFPDKWEKILLYTSLTWFVPYLMVRTSSESFATSLLILAYCLYHKKKFFYASPLFGFVFLARFQMAVLIAPLMILALCFKEMRLKQFAQMLGVIMFVILLGAAIDYWGYGTWTLSFYNYLYYNLVEGRSNDFGTEPIYFYLIKPLIKGVPLITIPILISYIAYVLRSKDRLLPICLVLFIFINSLIAHKEVRFLTPVYIILTIFALNEILCRKKWSKYINIYLVLNIIIMLKTSLLPAHSRVQLYSEVYKRSISILYTIKEMDKFNFSMPFYMKGSVEVLSEKKASGQDKYLLLTTNHDEYLTVEKRSNCLIFYSQYPKWIKHINITDWLSRSSYFSMWICTKNNT